MTPFTALTTPTGYLFVITYPYSGASRFLDIINTRENLKVLGNLGGPILPMSQAHESLQNHAVEGAVGQGLRHQALGWALAENFARNVLGAHKIKDVAGVTFSYWGTSRSELNRAIFFMYSFFPNSSFVFLTRNPKEVYERHVQKGKKGEFILRRINFLNSVFRTFSEEFSDVSTVVSFNQLSNPASIEKLNTLLNATKNAHKAVDSVTPSDPWGL